MSSRLFSGISCLLPSFLPSYLYPPKSIVDQFQINFGRRLLELKLSRNFFPNWLFCLTFVKKREREAVISIDRMDGNEKVEIMILFGQHTKNFFIFLNWSIPSIFFRSDFSNRKVILRGRVHTRLRLTKAVHYILRWKTPQRTYIFLAPKSRELMFTYPPISPIQRTLTFLSGRSTQTCICKDFK